MGQEVSILFDPRAGPDDHKDLIYMYDSKRGGSPSPPDFCIHVGTPFLLNFDDPKSLERELKRCGMAGIIVWDPTRQLWGEETINWPWDKEQPHTIGSVYKPGTLYIVGEDEILTSIIDKGRYECSAVFPDSKPWWRAELYLGGERLQQFVNVHRPGFPHRKDKQTEEESKKTK